MEGLINIYIQRALSAQRNKNLATDQDCVDILAGQAYHKLHGSTNEHELLTE
jgi:hypothetical protein